MGPVIRIGVQEDPELTHIDSEVIKNAVQMACRAPSLHNSQPWAWVAEAEVLQLFADYDRIGYATDSSGREVILSCGAVLDHLRVATAAAGFDTHTHRLPNPSDHDHLASLDFSALPLVTDTHRRRAAAIHRRRTDRRAFAAPQDWESFEPVLRRAFDAEAAMLDVVAEEARPRLARASRLTETLRTNDSSYHAELAWWTVAGSGFDHGMSPSALPSESEAGRVDVARAFPITGTAERRGDITVDQSKVVVLSTHNDSPAQVLRCGEALSAVLLECTIAGLATCILTHMIELGASRDIVRDVIRTPGLPQVLIRVGTVPPLDGALPPTPRRPLAEILEFRG